jgi:hypothetical protein
MSISNFLSSGGFEVGIMFFDVENVGFMSFESSSLSLFLGGSVEFDSLLEDLDHIVRGLLGSGGII